MARRAHRQAELREPAKPSEEGATGCSGSPSASFGAGRACCSIPGSAPPLLVLRVGNCRVLVMARADGHSLNVPRCNHWPVSCANSLARGSASKRATGLRFSARRPWPQAESSLTRRAHQKKWTAAGEEYCRGGMHVRSARANDLSRGDGRRRIKVTFWAMPASNVP